MSTEPQTSLHTYGDSVIVFETDTGRVVCGFDIRELLAIAAEKEAQQPKPTYKAPDYNRLKNLVAHFGNAVAEYVATKDKVPPNYPRSDLSLLEQIYAEIDSQHHPEQPLEMVAPADAELERLTGEPHIDGWPLYSGLPSPADVPLPEPVGFRTRYRSEPGMIGHYPWTYADQRRRKYDRPECEYEDLFTADQMHQYAEAYAAAKVAAERERCAKHPLQADYEAEADQRRMDLVRAIDHAIEFGWTSKAVRRIEAIRANQKGTV